MQSVLGLASPVILGSIGAVALILVFLMVVLIKQYRRCPSNKVLVVYGKVAGSKASKCLHGGGTFVVPLLQDYQYMSLDPMAIEIPLEGALSLNNIRVNIPATFTVGISVKPELMNNAAERLLGLNTKQIQDQAKDIIVGQLRLVIATLTIEEINKDREKFMALINQNVAIEINKIGLELINVNIRDITDESGYIAAIGKRAAAEAINKARVDVAQQERDGEIGVAIAQREKITQVAFETAAANEGKKRAEQQQRIAMATLEAEAITGEAQSARDQQIAQAQREAETMAARKEAERTQRVQVAEAEATAVTGENQSQQQIQESTAKLNEVRAEAKRRSDVAAAKSQEAILIAQREQEKARLAKEQIAPQEIEKQRIEIAAEAEAEKRRREASGEADAALTRAQADAQATLVRYEAEAAGTQKVLEAKAEGYRQLMEAVGSNPQIGPTLLLIEHLPQIVKAQAEAVKNLKIDKIVVWDSAGGDGNTTANFVSGLIGSLPKIHEMAKQAGINLPSSLGRITDPDGILES